MFDVDNILALLNVFKADISCTVCKRGVATLLTLFCSEEQQADFSETSVN
jgi:hypothetical protein